MNIYLLEYNMIEVVKSIIPKLGPTLYKGQAGKVLIVGGSREYTGAPYYAAISSLKTGADLAHIMCTPDASIAIKSYSPENIVHPFLPCQASPPKTNDLTEEVKSLIKRVSVVVVGPGLGRDNYTQQFSIELIEHIKSMKLPLIIDGDGIQLVCIQPNCVKGYENAIVTPNYNEFKFLIEKFNCATVKELSRALNGVTIIQKGKEDIISNSEIEFIVNDIGSGRRSGGQGDMLVGVLSTFLSWGVAIKEKTEKNLPATIIASIGACTLVRKAQFRAFQKSFRATTTPDMIAHIGEAFEELWPNSY